MSPLAISVVAFVLMLLGAAAAVYLRRVLADRHFTDDAKDIVRMSAGLMATLAALVLSLLISSANNAYEAQRKQLRDLAAGMVLLDTYLEEYGPNAGPLRERLRTAWQVLADGLWSHGKARIAGYVPSPIISDMHDALHALVPADERQRALRAQALQLSAQGAQARYSIYIASNTSLPTPFLVILIGWLTALFMSFCLFSQPNRIAVAALVILALSASSALFMLLELSSPFNGILALPEHTMRNALPALER